jgi:hypothetical protein
MPPDHSTPAALLLEERGRFFLRQSRQDRADAIVTIRIEECTSGRQRSSAGSVGA